MHSRYASLDSYERDAEVPVTELGPLPGPSLPPPPHPPLSTTYFTPTQEHGRPASPPFPITPWVLGSGPVLPDPSPRRGRKEKPFEDFPKDLGDEPGGAGSKPRRKSRARVRKAASTVKRKSTRKAPVPKEKLAAAAPVVPVVSQVTVVSPSPVSVVSPESLSRLLNRPAKKDTAAKKETKREKKPAAAVVRGGAADSDDASPAAVTVPMKEVAPAARLCLRNLEPNVTHLGKISYRVRSVPGHPEYDGHLKSSANISLRALAKVLLNRSRILTLGVEAERAAQLAQKKVIEATDMMETPTMVPVRNRKIRHVPIKLILAVRIGDDNIYLLYRMRGDRCDYETFYFIEDVLGQSLIKDHMELARLLEKQKDVPSWEAIDWEDLQ